MRRLLVALLLAAAGLAAAAPAIAQGGGEQPVRRVVLGLWDSAEQEAMRASGVFRMADMPLTHLGLKVRYHDIQQPMPGLDEMRDVRGILSWFVSNQMKDPEAYIDWAAAAMDLGIRFVVVNYIGAEQNKQGAATPSEALNRLTTRIGFRYSPSFHTITYDWKVAHRDRKVMDFERPLPADLPPFNAVSVAAPDVRAHLLLRRKDDPDTDTPVVLTSPRGGFIGNAYTSYPPGLDLRRQWLVNPFEFFRLAFDTDELPKPDPHTMSGRRMYYSHIDGDGWRNLTRIEKYRRERPTLSAEAVMHELLEPYPDLPCTVAPIVGDLDPLWYGDEETNDVARRIFALPQIEAGSHTYTHPFAWWFFENYEPAHERSFLPYYPPRQVQSKAAKLLEYIRPEDEVLKPAADADARWLQPNQRKIGGSEASRKQADAAGIIHGAEGGEIDIGHYERPRAYAIEPFTLEKEIQGGIDYIDRLLPPGKRTAVVQWSGDCVPFEGAVRATRLARVGNINGGDTRFDPEFPSYATVAPLSRIVGKERQIYASNSNENTYTVLWTDRFYAFQNLIATLENTETPIRVKPINVYYHMYSGERPASMEAVRKVLDYARTQEIAPVTTSHFTEIVEGFYSAKFVVLDEERWRILDRGRMQTVRFDRAAFKGVDFARSEGVLGQRHYQGSLYVALDESHEPAVVALKTLPRADVEPPAEGRPYLLSARWRLWSVRAGPTELRARVQGFGPGEMRWMVPAPGVWQAELHDGAGRLVAEARASAGEDGVLDFVLDGDAIEPAALVIRRAAALGG